MSNSNLPTNPSATDLAHAQQVVDRHSTTPPSSDGLVSGGEYALPDVSHLTGEQTDTEIRKITALAHVDRPADEDKYQRLQPRLAALIERKTQLMRGAPAARTPARAVADAPGAAAHDLMDYPSLPDDPSLPAEVYRTDNALWLKALPALRAAGVTPAQSKVMIGLIGQSAVWRAEMEASHRDQVQIDTRRELSKRYGPNYQRDVDLANSFMRQVLPGGRSRALAGTLLADGSRLGDHPDFVRLMIEFGKETRP